MIAPAPRTLINEWMHNGSAPSRGPDAQSAATVLAVVATVALTLPAAASADPLSQPNGVATDAAGNVFVADTQNHRIQVFESSGAFIRKWGRIGDDNGEFRRPRGVAVDPAGHVFVADSGNHRIQEFESSGTFIRKWGSYGSYGGQFQHPADVAVHPSGGVYVADAWNNRVQAFDSSGTLTGVWYFPGQFDTPEGIAIDSTGHIFVADVGHNRIVDSTGSVISSWGAAGTGDGEFRAPRGVAADAAGHVIVADSNNDRVQVFDTSGTFIRKWGRLGAGDGQFSYPQDVATDAAGHVFVADSDNDRIQMFDSSGTFIRKWGGGGLGGPLEPNVKGLDLRPKRFSVKPTQIPLGPPLPKSGEPQRRATRGSTIALRLSADALVHFYVRRRVPDSPRPAPGHRRGFARNLDAGAGSVRFTGKFQGRALKPGRYVLRARTFSDAGRTVDRDSAPFKILAG